VNPGTVLQAIGVMSQVSAYCLLSSVAVAANCETWYVEASFSLTRDPARTY
jgi:hypothetical protein